MNCNLCPRLCNVNRAETLGYCLANENITLAKVMLHKWEEPIICYGGGSGAIFFSGCNLRCVYCQNFDIARGKGLQITPYRLAEIFKELEGNGACNINLVTPSHYASQIVSACEIYKPNIPILYNCGGYELPSTLDMLDGIVDVYLPDFKYSDSALAKRLSNAEDYFEVASRAIATMRKQVSADIIACNANGNNSNYDACNSSACNVSSCNSGVDNSCIDNSSTCNSAKDIISNGKMLRGMIIRHLVLPANIENTFGVIDYLARTISKDSYVSLMGQYLPFGNACNHADINRPLKPLEYKVAINRLYNHGFMNAYVQDLSASDKMYVPDFDLSGVEKLGNLS